MRVSDSAKVLFVHVPKTGGSTIDRFFDHEVDDAREVADLPRHSTYRRMLKAEPELASYWSFGFVRNPWARLVSYWSMLNKVFGNAETGSEKARDKIARNPLWEREGAYRHDFDAFVLEATVAIPKVGRPQVRTLTGPSGLVEFIGRTEDFDEGVRVVRDRLGLSQLARVPRTNVSTHRPYQDYYNETTRRHVEEVFAPDIEAFGYSF